MWFFRFPLANKKGDCHHFHSLQNIEKKVTVT
jgi:hypothetical protein